MYPFLLFLHSWLRWVVIILMMLTLILSFSNWTLKKPFTARIARLFHLFRLSFGIQVLAGFLLYFIFSPVTTHYMYHDVAHMIQKPQSVFTLMHPVGMLIAFLVCKTGEQRAAQAVDPTSRYRTWFVFTLIVLIIILIAVPWPFYDGGRPLFR
jgi:hypothetical protein